jgi:hypothetical protein
MYRILTPQQLEQRQREHGSELYYALLSIVRTWEDPGPMGTMYEMPRAVNYAKSILGKIES